MCLVLLASSGCALLPPNSFLDPTKLGRFPGEFTDNEIRRVLTPRDTPAGVANATEPTPEDLKPRPSYYQIGKGDQITIGVEGLLDPAAFYQETQEVSPDGEIRLPILGQIPVADRTEIQVEEHIRNEIVRRDIRPDPVVRVLVQARRNAFFTIGGDVVAPGTYPLTQPDLRLLEAIGFARDVGPQTKRLYVLRQVEPGESVAGADESAGAASGGFSAFLTQLGRTQLVQDAGDRAAMEEVLNPGQPARTPPAGGAAASQERPFPPIIFEDARTGRVAEAPSDAPAAIAPPADAQPFDWNDLPPVTESQRVIEIDIAALKSGDPAQNIVVRNRDVIQVPVDTGVYYLMGEINRVGVFAFGGREITLKAAIGAIGGGLTPFAWPQRCEIVRRERGTDKQITIPVDLDRIFYGSDPDIVLQDDDLVNVGTHTIAPFLFVIRNSFRFTYGFGFVYDRNFADKDSFGSRLNPEISEAQRRATRGLPF